MNVSKRSLGSSFRGAILAIASVTSILVTGCGSDGNVADAPAETEKETSERLQALIGPEGGELVGKEGTAFAGVRVQIPAGALNEETEISVVPAGIDTPLPKTAVPCGPTFAVQPAGLELAVPASVTVPFDPQAVETQYRFQDEVKGWVLEGAEWGRLEQMDSSEDTVTFEMTSFSALAAGVTPPEEQDIVHFEFAAPSEALVKCFAQYPGDAKRSPRVEAVVVRGPHNDALFLAGKNFKPGVEFDLFSLERTNLGADRKPDPNARGFGLAWYQSDLQADRWGQMRVIVKTVLLDQIFGLDNDVKLGATRTFHMGFWFNDPQAAASCGFNPERPTPFNGEQKAGPLAMISFPDAETGLGPLCTKPNTSTTPATCDP